MSGDSQETMRGIMAAFNKHGANTTIAEAPEVAVHDEQEESLFIDDDDNVDAAPTDDTADTAPKQYNAMGLKSASKRKTRPFAPDEPASRKKSKPGIGKLIPGPRKPRNTRHRDYPKIVDLQYLRTLVAKCQQETELSPYVVPASFSETRSHLQKIALIEGLSLHVIEQSRLLQNGGLPEIVNKRGAEFPFDMSADAVALVKKWKSGDYDSSLIRGIQCIQRTRGNQTTNKCYKLEDGYPFKISPDYTGAKDLTNGQWWPLQACAVRDGAHGSFEAGISGKSGGVAYSVILGSSGYSNIDNGETVEYCGTSGRSKNPTKATNQLLSSVKKQSFVRLLRSSPADGKKTNKYLPKAGLRYDGLYKVVSFEILDEETAMHRFTLVRQPEQDPIRYTGDAGRPNQQEIEDYTRIRHHLGLKG